MLGKVFWGLVILLFIGILVIPFILPSYYASQAETQYYADENEAQEEYESGGGGRGGSIGRSKKKYSRSVRSSGGSRSYRSGK
ncbi:MAG: hypothetical protein D3925_04345 [Candidatus Electrothrix sp. AR5]|nr:hypothetical protein [Candidatus Electrothrix sp. AR5]